MSDEYLGVLYKYIYIHAHTHTYAHVYILHIIYIYVFEIFQLFENKTLKFKFKIVDLTLSMFVTMLFIIAKF